MHFKTKNKPKFSGGRVMLQTRWKNGPFMYLLFLSYASFVKQIDENCTWEK